MVRGRRGRCQGRLRWLIRWPWARLLRRVFAIDVVVCDRCADPRRILGAVTEPHAVRRLWPRSAWPPSRRPAAPSPPPDPRAIVPPHHRRRRPRLFVDPAGRVPGLISPTSRRLAGSSAARYTPPTAMTRRLELDLSGSLPFNQVVLPLISAVKHFLSLQKAVLSQRQVPACLAHPICVLDAPMVLAEGGPEAPRLTMIPWVRVVRQEAIKDGDEGFWRHYVIDVVHRGYVTIFVHQHLMPFAEQFADRAASVESLLAEGKAAVPDLKEWRFADLRPWK